TISTAGPAGAPGAAVPVELAVAASPLPDPLPLLSPRASRMTAAQTAREMPTIAMVRPRPFMRRSFFLSVRRVGRGRPGEHGLMVALTVGPRFTEVCQRGDRGGEGR